jgi:cation diffusion facilitator CzcD-associated flavoprotein CzcO
LSSSIDSSVSAVEGRNRQLATRYQLERDKRLNAKGNAQYIAIEGQFEDFARDPNATDTITRGASVESVDVVIVGGGITGILTSVELRRAGIGSFRVIEKGADFGGTWYWNRYPGIACDCESLIYLPLLEEFDYTPSAKYAPGAEIAEHLRRIAEKYALYENAYLQTQVSDIRWSDRDSRWVVATDRGDQIRAKFVVLGSGPLHRPKLPGIPGIRDFKGKQFHSSRWDYDYTGGSPRGGLDRLRDKRVAVVGTGSSGIQIVPMLARDAKHLYVVQRTPSIIDSRDNAPLEAGWAAGQDRGWQRRRMENFDALLAGMPQDVDLIGDSWTTIWGGGAQARAAGSPEAAAALMETLDFAQMERIRARVDEVVTDPATAAALKPYYGRFCKRPGFNDDYLPTFNRPNVTLINTDGRGLDRITETAIVFDGHEYEVDCIIYATGFEFAVAATRSGGFEVYSPTGQTLSEHRAQGVRSLHGIYANGFPNLFIIGGLHQAAVSINQPLVFGDQAAHVVHVIDHALDRGANTVEVRPEAQKRWGEVIAEKSTFNPEASRNCTPGAYNNENANANVQPGVFATAYGGGPIEYSGVLRSWRSDGMVRDLEFGFSAYAAALPAHNGDDLDV